MVQPDMTDQPLEQDVNEQTSDPDEDLLEALDTEEDSTEEGLTEEDPTEDEKEELYTVKINGEERKVSKQELIDRYQKEIAAEKRFEEAANIRKQYGERVNALTEQEQKLKNYIAQMDGQVQLWMTEKQPDWEKLLEEEPHEYLRQKEIYEKRQQALQNAMQARQALEQQQNARLQNETEERVRAEVQRIPELIPEWKDKAVAEKEQIELVDWLRETGYTDEDLHYLNQSRAENIALARKAMLYDKLQNKAKELKKRNRKSDVVEPIPTISGNRSKPRRSLMDPDLPYDDFVKMRREYVAKRRR